MLATAWRRRFRRYPGDWVWPVLGLLIVAALAAAVGILATQSNELGDEDARRDPGLGPVEHRHRSDLIDALDRHLDTADRADPDDDRSGATASAAPPPSNTLIQWPAGQNGWTIVLSSIPQSAGRAAAVSAAQKALSAGLTDVGILDSSQFSSLHTGYFVVFTGVYDSENKATQPPSTRRKAATRKSYVRQIIAVEKRGPAPARSAGG